jgi:glucose-6-phosphate dehydrogenase assembly protein OpcA
VEAAVTSASSTSGAAPAGASGRVSEAVGRVEAELAALWATPDAQTGQAKVRASMINLVIVAAERELDVLRESTDELTQTHPGRVFLLTVDGRIEPWQLRTEVTAVCRIDSGSVICSDRVEIAFGTMVSRRAASVIGSLALPELPLIVESAASAPVGLIDGLAARSDRLVVDSAHTPWARIAQLAAVQPHIADRNFVRAHSWRELCARFFDDVPRATRAIRSVEIARIEGGQGEPAALLLGWLAGRLGWRFESAERAVDGSGRPVAIARRADRRADLGPGEVTAVRIETELDGQRLDLACERTAMPRSVHWTMRGARTESHEYPLGFRDETWVLVKALDAVDGDRVYADTVRCAAELCGHIGG